MKDARFWFLHLVSGGIVGILLAVHMGWLHLNDLLGTGTDLTSFSSMMERSKSAGVAALYIALLVFGLYHGIYGLRNILLEGSASKGAARAITGILIVVGIVFLALGIYTPITLLGG